ncbi:glycosyltransferase [Eubacterium sp.]|uniref:glycosyltransferase n=1 Tax=Eubacterium sp. TaxID=142586 RepID=UPI002FC5EF0F
MKKIAMFTMGTRGDVQPYIDLSQALIKNGYDVILGSHPCWKNLIESYNINFMPIGPDIDIDKEAAIIRGKNKNPALSMLKTMKFVFDIIVSSSEDVFEVCKGKDLIIVSHAQMGATEAEVLGIPTINITLQTEMIPQTLKKQSLFESLCGKMIAGQIAKPYNRIRKKYRLKPVKDIGKVMSQHYDLIPISKYVKERNPYWEAHHVLTGFWYQEDKQFQPDNNLSAFLKEGEKPILLALGAMSFEDKEEIEKLDKFVKAFVKTGNRAIIQGFQKSLQNYKLPESMISIGAVPHSFLFHECKTVIHHCGFGTSSATLIYGIPSIPMPHVLDQIGQADMLIGLGVAGKKIDGHKFTEDDIIFAIQEMDSSYFERKQRVEALSKKIREEDGLGNAMKYIDGVLTSSICE